MKNNPPTVTIQITKDGPYLVNGALPLSEQHIVTNAEGESLDYQDGKKYPAQTQYALCRCGQSANKPFCDGTHKKIGFDGTEAASREPYLDQAETWMAQPCSLQMLRVCAPSPGSATLRAAFGIS